jgi:hypothetical protein
LPHHVYSTLEAEQNLDEVFTSRSAAPAYTVIPRQITRRGYHLLKPNLFDGRGLQHGDTGAIVVSIRLASRSPQIKEGEVVERKIDAGPSDKNSRAAERRSRILPKHAAKGEKHYAFKNVYDFGRDYTFCSRLYSVSKHALAAQSQAAQSQG